MRKRGIKKQVWLNKNEATMLKKKAKKAGLNEATLLRNLIIGSKLKEKPDDKFYESIKLLRSISNNINQISKRANALGFIDEVEYKREVKKIDGFIVNLKKRYLYSLDEE